MQMENEKEAVPKKPTLQSSLGIEARHDNWYNPSGQYRTAAFIDYAPVEDLNKHYQGGRLSHPQVTICGIPRKIALVVFVINAVLILALALGLGLGLGLGLPRVSRSAETTASISTSVAGSSSASTLLPATISSSSLSSSGSYTSTAVTTPTGSTTAPIRSCPSANSTTTTSFGHTFLIACNSDVRSNNKENLSSGVVASFDLCLSQCASMNYYQQRNDVSATYNWSGGGQQIPGTCWCIGATTAGGGGGFISNTGTDTAWIQS